MLIAGISINFLLYLCLAGPLSWTLMEFGASCRPLSLRTMWSRQLILRRASSQYPTQGPCSMLWSRYVLKPFYTISYKGPCSMLWSRYVLKLFYTISYPGAMLNVMVKVCPKTILHNILPRGHAQFNGQGKS